MNLLITGGLGYIGSHTCVVLSEAGHQLVILDNLSNSTVDVLEQLKYLCNSPPLFIQGDIRDKPLLKELLVRESIDFVFHFAALKIIAESVERPLTYYANNVLGSLSLIEAMEETNVRRLVFSSTAAVYGPSQTPPVTESSPIGTENPYGRSKVMVERMLEDIRLASPDWRIALLRYFNPVGAHPSARIGEAPGTAPTNLFPNVARAASGELSHITIFGTDYPTPDGTGVRDYIHVMDLAEGHAYAMNYLLSHDELLKLNLGTGRGYSVMEVVRAFEQSSGKAIPTQFAPRRPEDVASCWADPGRAARLMNWRARRTLEEMCIDTWRWQQQLAQIAR